MRYIDETNRIVALDENGNEIGEAAFSEAGVDVWIADHTYVSDDYRGQGVAQELVARMVDKAKMEEKRILPLCPFVKYEFSRVPEYLEVMK